MCSFIRSSNDQIYILEINARRCTSSYICDIIKRLNLGDGISWNQRLNLPARLTKRDCLVEKVIDIFDSFNSKSKDWYALPIQVSGLMQEDPYMEIIVFGESGLIEKKSIKYPTFEAAIGGGNLDV